MAVRKICYSLSLIFFLVSFLSAQNLKLEEVISKHTASIGTAEKQKELKNMVLLGSSIFESKLPERKSVGRVAIVSEASNLLFISSFVADSYPFEKIGIFWR